LITHQRNSEHPQQYLLDAGRWVTQRLGETRTPWPQLTAVLFTHHHMDHNVGWADVLMTGWQMGRTTPWPVYGPPFTGSFCAAMEDAYAYDRTRRPGASDNFGSEGALHDVREVVQGGVVLEENGLTVTAAVVPHGACVPSFAFRFDAEDRSIVISGDCTPNDALLQLADGADVLLHEVWHRPSLDALLGRAGRALDDREQMMDFMASIHTSETEVGIVARQAGVRKLLLTHYIPPIFDADHLYRSVTRDFTGDIELANDLTVA
jgi:ribonuclease BN (tRNA processing enzyme)